ncbi:MAG TPA: hypothetical protein VGS80_12410 [Ktedonobacterales bacterium]|nr:hypothetical protein [Ktedonobacterales bacterium]
MDENIEPAHARASRRLSVVSRRRVLLGTGAVASGVALGGVSRVWHPAVARAMAQDDGNSAVLTLRRG